MPLRNDKKLINAWAMYDWANSVYSLSIATALFPIYYHSVTDSLDGGMVSFFGMKFNNDSVYSFAVAFSFLLVAFISPLLSSIADYKENKLSFMKFFCYLGSAACCGLYFFTAENVSVGIVLFIIASIGFCGSLVYYNAYLPEITDEKNQDIVSAKGFSLGYIGSVILLLVNLVTIMKYDWFGFSSEEAPTRIAFLTVGIWWAAFAQITFSALKKFKYEPDIAEVKEKKRGNIFGGYSELKKVWSQLKHLKRLKNFLLAFFFYNMAVQTVMYLAVIFGTKEIKLDAAKLIVTVLIIQIVAIAGATIFSRISEKIGNRKAISISIFIWIGICVAAYFTYNEYQFYGVAFAVGMVMGGIQSLSRSTYSKLLPLTKDTASFFSFFDATDKLSTTAGTLVFGIINELTGSMRNSVLALIVFFVIGFLILSTVQNKPELKEANA